MRSMENNRIKSTTIWAFLTRDLIMWQKQGFLKTFLLKVAFILMELIFILRKIMYYGNANMPGDR